MNAAHASAASCENEDACFVKAQHRPNPSRAEAIMWLFVWLAISPMVMLCMKTLTSSAVYAFPYPWLLVGIANVITFGSCHCAIAARLVTVEDSAQVNWLHAYLLGILQGLEVGLGAVVIRMTTISLRTEIHMMAPVLMFLGGWISGLEKATPTLLLSIFVMTIGGVMATGPIDFFKFEMLLMSLGTSLLSITRWVLTQKMLAPPDSPNVRPSPLVLLYRMSPATAVTGLFAASVLEPGSFTALLTMPQQATAWLLIFGVGFGVFVIVTAEFRFVQLTSALLLAIMCPIHNVTVILADVLIKGTAVPLTNWFGIFLCAVSTAVYSHARNQAAEERHETQTDAAGQELRCSDSSVSGLSKSTYGSVNELGRRTA